jgi:meromycolic acid (3R)-3-hydroxyacyl-[acyl-carrier protein] dehydratase HadB
MSPNPDGVVRFETVRVGETLPELRKTITVDQIRAYAEASGDRNPIHLDDVFARSVGLPGVIAHGMLTMAFAAQVVTDWLGDRRRLTAFRGRFSGMVLPGDELRCAGTVVAKDDERRRLTIEVRVENQKGEKVFTKGVADVDFTKEEN